MLFVFLCSIDHVFVYVEKATTVHEECVEPAMECSLFAIEKLDPHIIVHQKVLTFDEKVKV